MRSSLLLASALAVSACADGRLWLPLPAGSETAQAAIILLDSGGGPHAFASVWDPDQAMELPSSLSPNETAALEIALYPVPLGDLGIAEGELALVEVEQGKPILETWPSSEVFSLQIEAGQPGAWIREENPAGLSNSRVAFRSFCDKLIVEQEPLAPELVLELAARMSPTEVVFADRDGSAHLYRQGNLKPIASVPDTVQIEGLAPKRDGEVWVLEGNGSVWTGRLGEDDSLLLENVVTSSAARKARWLAVSPDDEPFELFVVDRQDGKLFHATGPDLVQVAQIPWVDSVTQGAVVRLGPDEALVAYTGNVVIYHYKAGTLREEHVANPSRVAFGFPSLEVIPGLGPLAGSDFGVVFQRDTGWTIRLDTAGQAVGGADVIAPYRDGYMVGGRIIAFDLPEGSCVRPLPLVEVGLRALIPLEDEIFGLHESAMFHFR